MRIGPFPRLYLVPGPARTPTPGVLSLPPSREAGQGLCSTSDVQCPRPCRGHGRALQRSQLLQCHRSHTDVEEIRRDVDFPSEIVKFIRLRASQGSTIQANTWLWCTSVIRKANF